MDWPSSCQWVLQILKRKGGEDLVPLLKILRSSAEPILQKIAETFSEYTIHDIRHKDKVCEILGWLVDATILNQMSKYEVYFLISATYLHDIGMADIPQIFDKGKFLEWSGKQKGKLASTDLKREFIREFHHLRSEEYIRKSFADFGISNPIEAFIIGRIARGHRYIEELTDFELYPRKFIYKNESINIGVLAYFLQIADELDLSFERAPLLVYKTFNPENPISKLEWEKALSTSGVHLDREDCRRILTSALCNSEKIHRALVLLEGRIQAKLDSADQILDPSQSRLFPNRIKFQITSSGYEYLDLKFIFDPKAMLPLLTDRIYSRPQDAIRELLQNSIDACHHRSNLCEREKRDYTPRIVVKLVRSKDGKILEINDNGTGMDEHILSSYFGKIGRSFYRSLEFLVEDRGFLPLSELGIGILSVFMIADKVLIETKANDSLPYVLEIFPWDEHIFVTKGSKTSSGTNIKLWLKKDIKVDTLKEVAFYVRHVDIPIRVEVGRKKAVVTSEWWTFKNFPKLKGSKKVEHLEPLNFELETERFRCLISFPSKEHPILGRIPSAVTDITPKIIPDLIAISKNGIFVEYLDMYEFSKEWGLLASIDLDIRWTPVLLSLGRNSVKRDSHFVQLMNDVIGMFLTELSLLFNEYSQKNEMVFGYESLRIMSSIFNFHAIDNWSEKLRNFVSNYGMLAVIDGKQINLMRMSEVKLGEIFLTYPPFLKPHELLEIVSSLRFARFPRSLFAKLCFLTGKPLGALKTLLSQRKFILLTNKHQFETIMHTEVKSIDISSLILHKEVRSPITISRGGERWYDVDEFVIHFTRFTNCKTKRFLLLLKVNTIPGSLGLTIRHSLFVNMDNEFVKAVLKVFGEDFLKTLLPIIEALVRREYNVALNMQETILKTMQDSGISKIDRLTLSKEDVPSYLIS